MTCVSESWWHRHMGVFQHKSQQSFSQRALMTLAVGLAMTASADRSLMPLCQKPPLSESLFPGNNQCFANSLPAEHVEPLSSRVTEVNGMTLVEVLQESGDTYLAVLFYAQWCPFSKSLRPTFDFISVLFPGIYHVAVEESALRASELSCHGVHSFPSLFLQNKTIKVRYTGPRIIEALSHFYNDITGLQPSSSCILEQRIDFKIDVTEELVKQHSYTGIRSLKELFSHNDIYLTLAMLFLMLRIFLYVIPKVVSWVKQCYMQRTYILNAAKAVVRREACSLAEREKYIKKSKVDNGKGKGAEVIHGGVKISGGIFVKRWSSSSLSAVTLTGGSSSEGRENHRSHQGSF